MRIISTKTIVITNWKAKSNIKSCRNQLQSITIMIYHCFSDLSVPFFTLFLIIPNLITLSMNTPPYHNSVIHSRQIVQFSHYKKSRLSITIFFRDRSNNFKLNRTRILDPLPLGGITYTLHFGLTFANSFYFAYLWKNWSFNPRSIALLAGGIAFQAVATRVPNFLCEVNSY